MPAPLARTFPVDILNQCDGENSFQTKPLNLTSRGMFKGNVIPAGPVYQLWQASITLPNMDPAEWRLLSAFLAECYETRTPIRIFDPLRQKPLGTFGNTGAGAGTAFGDDTTFGDGTLWDDVHFDGLTVAENAPADRDSILLAGAPANQVAVTMPGDLMEIDGFLYECLDRTSADSLGRVRSRIRPRLREAVTIALPVKALRASVAAYLADADNLFISRSASTKWGSVSLSFIEAIP